MVEFNISKHWFEENAPVNAVAPNGSGSNLVFTAKMTGEDYNDWKIKLENPNKNDVELEITVNETAKEINIILATDSLGEINSTTKDIKEIIEGHDIANKLIDVSYDTGEDGTSTAEAVVCTLTGGVYGTVCQDTHVVVREKNGNQLYINTLPNSKYGANWKKLNLVDY